MARALVATMSPGTSCHRASPKSFLYCTRYVMPDNAGHVSSVPLALTDIVPTVRSFATTVNAFEALRLGEPLSVTTTVIVFVMGPVGPDGVQVNWPLVALIAEPGGALVRLKVSCCVGMS